MRSLSNFLPKSLPSGFYPLSGMIIALVIWKLLTLLLLPPQFAKSFAPEQVLTALISLTASNEFQRQILPSLYRVAIGLGIASTIGIPAGIIIAYFGKLNRSTHVVFQFLRMISPLAWMPLAVMLFGIGTNAVIFLIAIAAVWPILFSTMHGVQSVNPAWIKVVRMLGGNDLDVLCRAIIPGVWPDILAGLRMSLGLSWIILVPAEMLGVPSGLGYFILDCRDRFDYSELGAAILVIGCLGFFSDLIVHKLQRSYKWRFQASEWLPG